MRTSKDRQTCLIIRVKAREPVRRRDRVSYVFQMQVCSCAFPLVWIPLAGAGLIIRELTENQAFQLSCSPQPRHGGLIGLRLYHRRPQSQTTLLSLSRLSDLRVDLAHSGRLQLCGGLLSPQVNVTIPNIQFGDAGLYIFELSYTAGNSSEHILLGTQKVLLLVKSTGKIAPLFYVISLFWQSYSCLLFLSSSGVLRMHPQLRYTTTGDGIRNRASSAAIKLAGKCK